MFTVAEGFVDLPVSVPCGQCVGCRLERSRQWAMRCMHEASLYDENCFITLTFSDEFLPVGGSLGKYKGGPFQKFMKRLRKRFGKMRFFHCGEYGDVKRRPHYHACLFGFDFPDKVYLGDRKGFPVWRSAELEGLWPFGRSEIGSVSFESAAYVARYVMKKVTGPSAEAHYGGRTPEYVTMSRRPGIGQPWLEKYMAETFPEDSVVVRGRLVKPPRYYFGKYELVDAPGALEVARARRRARRLEDETPERLLVREQCTRARLARSRREVE